VVILPPGEDVTREAPHDVLLATMPLWAGMLVMMRLPKTNPSCLRAEEVDWFE
jgi:hypothetical protein